MKTETVAIDSISLDPANVRRHPDRNIQTIVASLKRFGQQKPIVVTKEGIVIAGNGTLQAARHLGWKQIEIVRTGLTGSDATAYAIADNRTAELAEWDDDALAQTLAAQRKREAREAYETLVPVLVTELGPEHPTTVVTMGNMANFLSDQGQHERAAEMLERVVRVTRRIFGAVHPDTRVARRNLAKTRRVIKRIIQSQMK